MMSAARACDTISSLPDAAVLDVVVAEDAVVEDAVAVPPAPEAAFVAS